MQPLRGLHLLFVPEFARLTGNLSVTRKGNLLLEMGIAGFELRAI
jgi:hypothetical protein